MQGTIYLRFYGTREQCDAWAYGIVQQPLTSEMPRPVNLRLGLIYVDAQVLSYVYESNAALLSLTL